MIKIYLNKYTIFFIVFVICSFMVFSKVFSQQNNGSPFEKELPPLIIPEYSRLPFTIKGQKKMAMPVESCYEDLKSGDKSYIYQPKEAFKLVISKNSSPLFLPEKDVYGIIRLTITPDYKAYSRVMYMKKPYRFDRLSWAIKTGWNDTIPFFSRLSAFKKYLEPFDVPVYAYFYIKGVREYPEYPGQYFHWPREELEEYYLYILRKIDTVASQN